MFPPPPPDLPPYPPSEEGLSNPPPPPDEGAYFAMLARLADFDLEDFFPDLEVET